MCAMINISAASDMDDQASERIGHTTQPVSTKKKKVFFLML